MVRLAVGRWPLAERRSPRFEAGSVEKRITSRVSAKCSAAATEIVVLPTPPLPPNRTTRRDASESSASANGQRPAANLFSVAGVDADAALVLVLVGGDLAGHLFLPRADFTQRGEHLPLLARVLLLGDVAHFQHHLQLD